MIDGFCISAVPRRQGSGYYRSSTDNYNLAITYNAPFVTCSSAGLPSGNPAPLVNGLNEAVCGPDACQYDEDTPECDRQIRTSKNYYVTLKGQNYGSGGRPRCSAVVVWCQRNCCIPSGMMLTYFPG